MERVTGIEPALSAWEAEVLPLNYTREASCWTQRVQQPNSTSLVGCCSQIAIFAPS